MSVRRVYPKRVAYDAYQVTSAWADSAVPGKLGFVVHRLRHPDAVGLTHYESMAAVVVPLDGWLLIDTEGRAHGVSKDEFEKHYEDVIF